MSENQIIRVISSIPTWNPKILNSNLPDPVPLVYTLGGAVTNPKLWVNSGNTSGGSITFNITDAGFSSLIGGGCAIHSNDVTANQGVWAVITNLTTTSCTVTTYHTTSTGVVVLGIPVLASIQTDVYTGVKNISVIVIGT